MKVLEGGEGDVLLAQMLGQAVPGEDQIGGERDATVGDTVAHIHQVLTVPTLAQRRAFAGTATACAPVAALRPDDTAPRTAKFCVVCHDLEPAKADIRDVVVIVYGVIGILFFTVLLATALGMFIAVRALSGGAS